MEYLRVGVAMAIGVAMFTGWCLRPRSRALNDVAPERAMSEALAATMVHGTAVVLILAGLSAWHEGLIDRDVVLANTSRGKHNGYVMGAWSFATFYLLLALKRFLLGPDTPPE